MNRRSDPYTTYAQLYDTLKGDRSVAIHFLEGLLYKYRPGSYSILELACGTGSLLQGLPPILQRTGLDNSPSMLHIARQKAPDCTFIEADMAHFDLRQQFDVIFCMHNSINHLQGLEHWESLFRTVKKHLSPHGIFILDVNTPERMQRIASLPAHTATAGMDRVVTKVIHDKYQDAHYVWHLQLLQHQSGKQYKLTRTDIDVYTYPRAVVTAHLERHFEIAEHLRNITLGPEDTDREFYICRKR